MKGRKAYHRGQVSTPPPKDQRPCCPAKRDEFGRLPVGRCGTAWLGHPEIWFAHLKEQQK